ncbi:hypothetical protein EX30DRAFT_365692 [Ascodesmis nigricans]|uniref:Uncharacterized protein n=1 Tax=Ascodesmis nigricans TaxID=341454 RepID=A0A4S2MP18_9PEZI|nr:hypothetical protein EX30DRAFT_365692 [Ascodesmis nigricans]
MTRRGESLIRTPTSTQLEPLSYQSSTLLPALNLPDPRGDPAPPPLTPAQLENHNPNWPAANAADHPPRNNDLRLPLRVCDTYLLDITPNGCQLPSKRATSRKGGFRDRSTNVDLNATLQFRAGDSILEAIKFAADDSRTLRSRAADGYRGVMNWSPETEVAILVNCRQGGGLSIRDSVYCVKNGMALEEKRTTRV